MESLCHLLTNLYDLDESPVERVFSHGWKTKEWNKEEQKHTHVISHNGILVTVLYLFSYYDIFSMLTACCVWAVRQFSRYIQSLRCERRHFTHVTSQAVFLNILPRVLRFKSHQVTLNAVFECKNMSERSLKPAYLHRASSRPISRLVIEVIDFVKSPFEHH